MKSVLVFEHAAHEGPGHLAQALEQAGVRWEPVELYRRVPATVDPSRLAGLVVMGGPMNVDQTDVYPFLAPELDWIRRAVDCQLPVLGICLGAQLLAKALGARVRPNGVKEIGWYEVELTASGEQDRLLGGCGRRQTVFQWHGDRFDLPAGAVQLARSQQCEQQAFRYGTAAYGLQFHVEVTAAMVHQWLDEPDNCGELAELDYIDPERIRSSTPAGLAAMGPFADRVMSRFAAMCRQRA